MSTVHTDAERSGERVLVFTKGAPDVLLARCSHELVGEAPRPLSDARRADLLKTNDDLAGRALANAGRRVPCAAGRRRRSSRDIDERAEHELVFAGVIGMIDPPRDEARDAVARAKRRRHPPDDDHGRSSRPPPV